MYIKQVIIEGFRSYREQTVIEPFDPRHNVIVGRNGCGKSNFFKAIQFVLSDEYTNLKEEDRIGLLHEGSGPKVMSAYVEIIFDNSDGRFPIEKDEVAIKRAIGIKKDQYFLDKKVVTKADILNFLETAGFSRNNPYYIVKQGKINELSTAKDSFRLKILKEVAGSNVYDEKKEESRQILKETDDKRQTASEILKAIEERLIQLEVEKEELKEFQKWDKMKRSIEYTIHNKELDQTQSKLDELQKQRSHDSAQSNELFEKLNEIGERNKEIEKIVGEMRTKENFLREEIEELNKERSEYLTRKARFEFDMNDNEEEIRQSRVNMELAERDLVQVNKLIESSEVELKKITPEYDQLRAKEAELSNERDMCEQQRNEIFAKQSRGTRFASKEARDQWIKDELKMYTKTLQDKTAMANRLKQELNGDQAKVDTYKSEVQDIQKRADEQNRVIESMERESFDLVRRKDEAQIKRNDLWRKEIQLTQELGQLKDEQTKCEQNLRSFMGRTILQGIESINTILKQIENDPANKDMLKGYHGLLIDNLTCDKSLYTAVESSVSNRLFYHVVDSDALVLRFIKMMNSQKLPGEVNYLPLNQLRNEGEVVNYPENNDAIPLISRINYEKKVEKAVKHVFDKIILCRTAHTATELAKQTRMDCVLLDGDFVSRKGALTGGYVDTRQSKLQHYKQKLEISEQIKAKEAEINELQKEILKIDTELNATINEIQKHENKIKRTKDVHEQMKSDLQTRRFEIERYERVKPQKQASVKSLELDIEQFNARKASLEAEMGTELVKRLSTQDQTVVDDLNDRIGKLNTQLKQILQERSNIESKKLELENQLGNNLTKKRQELVQEIEISQAKQRTNKSDLYKSELNLMKDRIGQIEHKLAELNATVDKLIKTDLIKYVKEQEKLQDTERKIQDELQESTVDLEKVSSKMSLLLKKKEECLKATRSLGVLPQDAHDKYADMSMKQLYAKLDHCNSELKKLSHVNKKAMDQFVQFSEHKEKLIQRKEEAERAFTSIQQFIQTLDRRKNENMQMTFKQVCKYFSDIFVKLVPEGTGHLVMRKFDNFEEEDRQTQSQNSTNGHNDESNAEEYTGVGIRVSFAGKSNEMKDIQQLSGGQKSLVALALIFAIQRCDPAPFYLFDEIDQALDPQYRKAVADIIHDLSDKAQFITTTFRAELLEHANKYYGVRFRNKISIIDCVTKEEAFDFVEDDQTHK